MAEFDPFVNIDSNLVPPMVDSEEEESIEMDSTMMLMMLFEELGEINAKLDSIVGKEKAPVTADPNLFGTTSNQLEY